VLALLVPGAATAGRPAAPFTIALTVAPSEGPAPLLVGFSVVVTGGTPTAADWSFGDGSYLNSSGPADLDPGHIYAIGGAYEVLVQVWEGTSSALTSATVEALGNSLGVRVLDAPGNGTAPLTVEFQGLVTGGTGTYPDLNWSFGDGAHASGTTVSHTFVQAGNYNVTLRAVDSAGDVGLGGALVRVTGASSGGLGSLPSSVWLYLIPVGLAAGAFAAVIAVRRRRSSAPPPAGVYGGFVSGAGTDPADLPEPGLPAAPTDAGAAASAVSLEAETPGGRPDPRRVTREVVVFLYRLGRVAPDDLPTSDWTQSGIGERLAIPQNVLSNVLRRLEAAGVVTSLTEHVHGRPRRVKTYYLTSAGERLARGFLRPAPTIAQQDAP
jgi:hypothetical protein